MPSYGVSAPVCPRHPDRISYVTCQRCGRPVCPECQRPAAVGVQCVDCVREARSRTPRTRTPLGGRARAGRPVITLTIIVICAAIELLRYVAPGLYSEVYQAMAFSAAIGEVQPYRFLSAAFLHGGLLHLAFNMYALWIVGGFLEQMLGRWRYAALFLLSAIGGSVGYLLLADPLSRAWTIPVVGASGAVFGLFAAIVFVLRSTGRNASQILVLIAINVVIGFVVPGIAWQAHLGGMVTGALLAVAFVYAPPRIRSWSSPAACVAVAVLLVVASFAKYAAV
nr:rhomboid family intramembrane serine protease [Beutenbergia cavernae]